MTLPISLSTTAAGSVIPADTDRYIYRPVLRLVGGEWVTEYMQIWIRQP